MTRKTVELTYITDDSARKATYRKRTKGLMKKVSELTTLCGVEACAIIYPPPGSDSQLEVWPSHAGVNRLISEFQKLPVVSQNSKMVTPEILYRKMLAKANEQLKKHKEENRKKELSRVMFQNLSGQRGLQNLNVNDLKELWWLIQHTLEDVDKRLDTLTTANSL